MPLDEPLDKMPNSTDDALTVRMALAFNACTLPKIEWTHEAHLRVGLWHLLHFTPEEALTRLRVGISRYNLSCGVANTEHSGYHESITRFYVWVIDQFLSQVDRARPIDDLAEELIRRYGDRELPLNYWSKPRLRSVEARLGWVEPDIQPLENYHVA